MLAMCANAQPGLHKKRPVHLLRGPGVCYSIVIKGLRPITSPWSGFFCTRLFGEVPLPGPFTGAA
jgi:hypothetical protein